MIFHFRKPLIHFSFIQVQQKLGLSRDGRYLSLMMSPWLTRDPAAQRIPESSHRAFWKMETTLDFSKDF